MHVRSSSDSEEQSYERVGRLLVLGLEGKLANVQDDAADAQTA